MPQLELHAGQYLAALEQEGAERGEGCPEISFVHQEATIEDNSSVWLHCRQLE